MTIDLGKFSARLSRICFVFRIFSVLAAACLVASMASATIMLLGDHALLAPIVPEASDPLPPPGILPVTHLILTFVDMALLALTAVSWLFWLTSSSQFARRAGANEMRFSPAMAAVWHFVPVMAYVMPMLVLVELEAATRSPTGWKDVRPSRLAATTWLVGKIAAIGFSATCLLPSNAETASQYVNGLVLTSVSSIGVLGALLLANLLAIQMRRFQDHIARDGITGVR